MPQPNAGAKEANTKGDKGNMGVSDYTNVDNPNNTQDNNPNSNDDRGMTVIVSAPFFHNTNCGEVGNPIEDILVNMNKKKHTPTLYRDGVIEQMISVLIGDSKPNVLLTGAAGTGKTKIVEELANRIENKDISIPNLLQGYTIYSLQISDMVANSHIVGELEEKVKALIDFLSADNNKAILFIDEIHVIFISEVYTRIAQILKPALSRGMIKVIGATTTQEMKNIEGDPAFRRRFTKVLVDELSKKQTVEILNVYTHKLKEHYGTQFNYDKALGQYIVDIADEFCSSSSHRPDNAITLLDQAIANAIVDKHGLLSNSDPAIRNMAQSMSGVILSKRSIQKTAMRIVTGHNEPKEFIEDELRSELSVIKGQDDVLDEIIMAVKLHSMHIRPRKTPLTFLFAGSSGVGKTEVTKILSKCYTGEKPIMLNMAEYHSSASINRIIGAPAGYIGYDNKDELPFDILETNPYKVILLDEFDKCDKNVQNLFMNVFEEGYLKTNHGKTVDFSKSLIIATTNAGCMDISNPLGFNVDQDKKISVRDLAEYFDIALINRFNYKCTFNDITHDIYEEIMRESYKNEVRTIKELKPRICLDDEISDAELKELVNGTYNPKLGARPVKTAITEFVDNKILEGWAS